MHLSNMQDYLKIMVQWESPIIFYFVVMNKQQLTGHYQIESFNSWAGRPIEILNESFVANISSLRDLGDWVNVFIGQW